MDDVNSIAGVSMNATEEEAADVEELKVAEIMDKIKEAERRKDQGNIHFRNKEIQKAIKLYHQALLYVKGVHADLHPPICPDSAPKVDPATNDKTTELRASINNNLAACLLKKSPVSYERVVQCCEEVIELQPDNTKGWYRLALAQYRLRMTDKAKVSIMRANRLADGKDAAIRKLLGEIEAEIKSEQASFDEMFKDKLINRQIC